MAKAPPSTRPLRGFAPRPATPGSRYTPEETVRLQEMFLPQSSLYRRRQRQALITFLVGSVPYFGSLLLNGLSQLVLDRTLVPLILAKPLGILCVISIIIGIGVAWSRPLLKCPACHSLLDHGISRHCPECGSDQLDRNMFGSLCCQSCGKNLEQGRNKGRVYRIHACTGCGLMLDYHGL